MWILKEKSFSPLVYYGAGHNQTNSLADGSPIVTVDSTTGETFPTHNRVNVSSVEYFRYNFEVLGNYSFSVNENNFNVFAGFSMTKNTGQGLHGSAVDAPLTLGTSLILVLQQELKSYKPLNLGILLEEKFL